MLIIITVIVSEKAEERDCLRSRHGEISLPEETKFLFDADEEDAFYIAANGSSLSVTCEKADAEVNTFLQKISELRRTPVPVVHAHAWWRMQPQHRIKT